MGQQDATTKPTTDLSFAESLWRMADKLCGTVGAALCGSGPGAPGFTQSEEFVIADGIKRGQFASTPRVVRYALCPSPTAA